MITIKNDIDELLEKPWSSRWPILRAALFDSLNGIGSARIYQSDSCSHWKGLSDDELSLAERIANSLTNEAFMRFYEQQVYMAEQNGEKCGVNH